MTFSIAVGLLVIAVCFLVIVVIVIVVNLIYLLDLIKLQAFARFQTLLRNILGSDN